MKVLAAALIGVLVLGSGLVQAPVARGQQESARPWLGLALDSSSTDAGARVSHVVRGSPAQTAGIRAGDRIVRVGSMAVATGGDVVKGVATFSVGDSVSIALVRGGAPVNARATLAAFPSQDAVIRMDLVGAPAPELVDAAGASGVFPASLAELRGRVVLLDFWATWCAPCRVVVPKLDSLRARYGPQGLSVLGLSSEDPVDIASFARAMSLRYPLGADRSGKTSRAYGVGSLPTLVIIDKHGVVRDVAVGYDPGADAALEASVRALIAEP